jgi:hypothetical protein
MGLSSFRAPCLSLSALLIDYCEIDGLHLISVRPQGLCHPGWLHGRNISAWPTGYKKSRPDSISGSLALHYFTHTLVTLVSRKKCFLVLPCKGWQLHQDPGLCRSLAVVQSLLDCYYSSVFFSCNKLEVPKYRLSICNPKIPNLKCSKPNFLSTNMISQVEIPHQTSGDK